MRLDCDPAATVPSYCAGMPRPELRLGAGQFRVRQEPRCPPAPSRYDLRSSRLGILAMRGWQGVAAVDDAAG